MKLSTGKAAFPIEFDNGEKRTIYFNPADPDLFSRMRNFEDRATKKLDDLKNENDDIVTEYENLSKVLCEELDYAFGGDISSVIFEFCSPFAIVDGEFFLLQFIKAITPEIKKYNEKANKQAEKKMNSYINKYKK